MKEIPTQIRDSMASRFGMDAAALVFFGGGQDWSDGTVYRSPGPGGGPDLVLKILDFPDNDRQALARSQARLELLGPLSASGSCLLSPRPALDGSVFVEAAEGDKRYLGYAYPFAAGRTVEEGDPCLASGALYRSLGAELGRLHAAAEVLAKSPAGKVSASGASAVYPELGGWREEMDFFASWCAEPRVARAWERLRTALAELAIKPEAYGFIHNDAHLWNFLFDPQSQAARSGSEPQLCLIDFDVANFHWYLADCAAAIYSFHILARGMEEPGRSLPTGFEDGPVRLFWEGYRRHRDPGPDWQRHVDIFLHYRRCLLFMPFQEQTKQRPDWRDSWLAAIEAGDKKLFG